MGIARVLPFYEGSVRFSRNCVIILIEASFTYMRFLTAVNRAVVRTAGNRTVRMCPNQSTRAAALEAF